ncbi:MAG: hypothetical protein QOH73_2076 [Gaiellaceae bacterium]|jgi:hypothetical protein|nr:hypothetical protein [Gaiellaceae bacterium]
MERLSLLLVAAAAVSFGVVGIRSGSDGDLSRRPQGRIGPMQDAKQSLLTSERLEVCVSEGSVQGWSETRASSSAPGGGSRGVPQPRSLVPFPPAMQHLLP